MSISSFTISEFVEATGLDAKTVRKRLKIIKAEPVDKDGLVKWCTVKGLTACCMSSRVSDGIQERDSGFFQELRIAVLKSTIRKIEQANSKDIQRLVAEMNNELSTIDQHAEEYDS